MHPRNRNILAGILIGVIGTLAVVFRKAIAGFITKSVNGEGQSDKKGNNNND